MYFEVEFYENITDKQGEYQYMGMLEKIKTIVTVPKFWFSTLFARFLKSIF